MQKTTVAHLSFLVRLRVRSDGVWCGQVEQIGTGRRDAFRSARQLVERMASMLSDDAQDKDPR